MRAFKNVIFTRRSPLGPEAYLSRVVFRLVVLSILFLPGCINFEPEPIPTAFGDPVRTSAPFFAAETPPSIITAAQMNPGRSTPLPFVTLAPAGSSVNPIHNVVSDSYLKLTVEEILFTVPQGWTSCSNIAAHFGISLDALYTANPEIIREGRCVLESGQVLTIPPLELLTPAEYVQLYECTPGGTRVCLQPDDSLEVMVAHTLFGEGGSTLGPGSAANIMQVAINRLNNLLEHRGIYAGELSTEEYQRLLIHILAQPYQGAHEDHPAFNAFADPYSHPQDRNLFQESSISSWNAALEIARSALAHGNDGPWWPSAYPPDARILNPDNHVLYYCSGPSGNPPFNTSDYNSIVAAEERDNNTLRSQWYYYNSSQHCSWQGGSDE